MLNFLIVTMGSGETGQGVALGKYLLGEGHQVAFGIFRKENTTFAQGLSCQNKTLESPFLVKQEIEAGKYDVVVFCNSKMFNKDSGFFDPELKTESLLVSLDSNWLFSESDFFPLIKLVDRIYLNFPEEVYKIGLKINGGHFEIPDEIIRKIETVGLIPSYPPLDLSQRNQIRSEIGITLGQKLIFCYIGNGINFRSDFYPHLLEIMDGLYLKFRDKIKVIFIGNRNNKPERPWLIKNCDVVTSEKFHQLLAASDLVFQHQGLGTLEQAISAQVPVIANVTDTGANDENHTQIREIIPFTKIGLCKMHYYTDGVSTVLDSIEKLLFSVEKESMIGSQKKQYSQGEKNILDDIGAILEKSFSQKTKLVA